MGFEDSVSIHLESGEEVYYDGINYYIKSKGKNLVVDIDDLLIKRGVKSNKRKVDKKKR